MKKCSKCNKHKKFELFSKSSTHKDGFQAFCKDCAKELKGKWYLENKHTELPKIKQYQADNKEYLAQKHNEYILLRKKEDVAFKLACNLRIRLNKAIKLGRSVSNLGCSVEELKIYLQSKFQPGMTWENYGQYGWHIDHIKPLSKFNLNDSQQLKEACHYTNLQPLWWYDNLSKGNS